MHTYIMERFILLKFLSIIPFNLINVILPILYYCIVIFLKKL